MGLALGAAIDALASEITAVFHSHVEGGAGVVEERKERDVAGWRTRKGGPSL